MEGAVMTDHQYNSMMKMVKMILAGCKDIEEAKRKIDELIEEKDQ